MEIVKFLNHTWQEIPYQDNPAMNHMQTKDGWIKQECIMIFKGNYQRITDGGFVVALVPKDSDIIKMGVFWTSESAEMFAEAFEKEQQDESGN